MPDIYDIDYNQQALDISSPDKRDPQPLALTRALLKSIQWSRDLVLGSFKTGSTAPVYSAGAYNIYDQVKFGKSIYECITQGTTNDPTNTTDWRLIQSNFIGIDDRIKYNGQKIVLEWALNLQFDGVFRQPATGLSSDIYIGNIAASLAGYRIGQTEAGGSSTGQTTSSDSIGGTYPFVQLNNFQINFKSSLFSLTNEQAVRNFVDKYIPISLNYIIVQY